MDAVLKAVALVDADPSQHSVEEYRHICALLKEASSGEKKAKAKNDPIPLIVARYAIYRLAFPTYAIELTPSFLDLLTIIELHRNQNLHTTKHHFPHIFEDEEQVRPSGTLDPNVEAELAQLTHELTGLRSLFWTIVVNICQHELYQLATAHSITDFWIRFNEYLPFLSDDGPPPRPFHLIMSDQEKQTLIKTTSEVGLANIVADVAHSQHSETTQPTMEQLNPILRLYVDTVCRQSEILEKAMTSL